MIYAGISIKITLLEYDAVAYQQLQPSVPLSFYIYIGNFNEGSVSLGK